MASQAKRCETGDREQFWRRLIGEQRRSGSSIKANCALPRTAKTLHVAPEYDREVETDIQAWFEQFYSICWRNYPVDASYLHQSETVGPRPG